MTKMIPLEKIKDSPYRDKIRNPMNEERIEQLVESIEATDFWAGVQGRELEDGTVQIAFGHTRIDAARTVGLKEVPLEILPLSDKDMLMRMTRENLRGELLVCAEAVAAAVKAFGSGVVEFEALDPSTRKDVIRYAPSFIPGKEPKGDPPYGHRAYTADTLARFLGGSYVRHSRGGRAQDSVSAALGMLEMEERKVSGFSERILRTQDDEGIQYLSAKKIIKVVADVKDREIRGKERTEKAQKAEQDVLAEQVRLENAQKERQRKAEAEYQESLREEAEAKREENRREVERLRKEREEKAEALAKKEKEDVAKKEALDVKLKELKEKAAEQRKVDDYAPIRREVETLLLNLGLDPRFTEESKALSRKNLTPNDRERLRQAALKRGVWFSETFSNMFLPPITATEQVAEYKSREEAKQRAEEAKKENKKK